MEINTDSALSESKIDKLVDAPFLKRLFDIALSLLFLIVAAPLFMLIFLAMKIEGLIRPNSRGPFFYSEVRISQGRPFKFLKIRTFKMSILNKMLQENVFIHTKQLERGPNNLTAVGSILKQFYLDEMAQFINVFMGDMSFIGPRPWNVVDYENEIGRGIYRKKVIKAGLTGLVQITKDDRHKYPGGDCGLDDYYIKYCRNNSQIKIMLFDLWIMAMSLFFVLKGQGL